MWDAYPKEFKGFHLEDLKKQKQLAKSVRNGSVHPREYDKHTASMQESKDPIYPNQQKNK